MIALPLKCEQYTFGCFSIYCTNYPLDCEQEVELLQELAEDLSKGIATSRLRAKRERNLHRLREEAEASG